MILTSRYPRTNPSQDDADVASRDGNAAGSGPGNDGVQGEGDYKAARRFNEAAREFVAAGKVPTAARAAAPRSEAERRQPLAAEERGKRRAKEETSALTRPRPDAGKPAG